MPPEHIRCTDSEPAVAAARQEAAALAAQQNAASTAAETAVVVPAVLDLWAALVAPEPKLASALEKVDMTASTAAD